MSKTDIRSLIRQKRVYFDGGLGTMLQGRGLPSDTPPELWNISYPDVICDVHRQYLEAGANVITTNTFGINSLKYENYEELITAAIRCAKTACADFPESYVAFDIGPSGKLLKPLGDLPFEDAVELFAKNIRVAAKSGVDLIIIETMTDSYETKAAVLAAKENCELPIFVTNVYDGSGKMMTGASPVAMIALLEGLGVDAIGMNCSLGPDKMIPLMKEFRKYSSLPIVINPNAGLPEIVDGRARYAMGAEEFAEHCVSLAREGAGILGGCCGTEPSYIRALIEKTRDIPLPRIEKKDITLVSSYTHAVEFGISPILIGERINPTGKPKFKEALRSNDMNYILGEGLRQADAGVHILDVNVGLPEIDETELMKNAIYSLQSVTDLPLQIDSSDPSVLAEAMRIYNGKPLINSVNGNDESMEAIFPLVKKYGGAIVALTLDRAGIPDTAEGRIAIAKRIIARAEEFGIDKKDLIFDPLALTVSSDQTSAVTTLNSIKMLSEMGLKTGLGVSNVSFGLPSRDLINSTFFANALSCGLSSAIMNPFSHEMMGVYHAFRALWGLDPSCAEFISFASGVADKKAVAPSKDITLRDAIAKGLLSLSESIARMLISERTPLDIINGEIIPALDEVGRAFEEKKLFLPQLLMSADAANAAFSVVKEKIPPKEDSGDKFILATVKGDIHDIGKNIVRVLLESYGFTVLDLGRVGETAELWLNGQYVGERICPPYRFDLSRSLKKGENSIRVRVCGNPGHRMRDGLSAYFMSPPTGIQGPITLIEKI